AGYSVQLIDADVEGPNSHHFLPLGAPLDEIVVRSMLPEFDQSLCTLCGQCTEFCAFSALAMTTDRVLLFADMCHGCEGCREICPTQAIRSGSQEIGIILNWRLDGIDFWQGRLHTGQVLTPALIRELKRRAGERTADLTIVDCPPGTACAMMAAVKNADHLLLVTEPTPFGRHDLELAMAATRRWKTPCEVVVNRSEGEDSLIEELCQARAVPVLDRLPLDRAVATAYAGGHPMYQSGDTWKTLFQNMVRHLEASWR
ncbi:MAG TPA: 4Fe-4S binding protein, partial [Candidatus Ozemobacteraceae bacterium]|nr:4Fe-4S binding protein [Candidatus Ozemobacteraceae bacterium]